MAEFIPSGIVQFGQYQQGPTLEEVAPQLLSVGEWASKEIASKFSSRLRSIGSDTVNDLIMFTASRLPYPTGYLVLTHGEYKKLLEKKRKAEPMPEWVQKIVMPLVNPAIEGATDELKKRIDIVTPRITATISILVLTLIGIGATLGVVLTRKRK